jgi:Mg-chelatase subunit ChlD
MRWVWAVVVLVAAASTAPAADRVSMIRDLAATPSADAVDEVLALATRGRPAPAVRQAAFEALFAMGADDVAAQRMLAVLKKESARRTSDVAGPLAVILLSRPESAAGADTLGWLDGEASSEGRTSGLLWIAATELARRDDADAVRLLARMTATRSFTRDFSFRRGVVAGLVAIRRPEAGGELVTLLASLAGEVRADVVAYLTAVSGQRHGLDAAAWAEWWRSAGDTFRFPASIDLRSARMAADADVATYYDIPLYAERLVFVIDVSGSMAEPRMESAKSELVQAILGLPDTAEFTIVAFSDAAAPWRRVPVPADEANKRAAVRFVAGLVPGGRTASFDALEAAFSFDVEAVYFLSDGEPTRGRLVDPDAITRFVTAANRGRRVSVYTIGIMPEPRLAAFLDVLAADNFGLYRQID